MSGSKVHAPVTISASVQVVNGSAPAPGMFKLSLGSNSTDYLPSYSSAEAVRAALLPFAGLHGISDISVRSGFRVQDSGFRVQGSGFRVQGSGFRVQCFGFRVPCSFSF